LTNSAVEEENENGSGWRCLQRGCLDPEIEESIKEKVAQTSFFFPSIIGVGLRRETRRQKIERVQVTRRERMMKGERTVGTGRFGTGRKETCLGETRVERRWCEGKNHSRGELGSSREKRGERRLRSGNEDCNNHRPSGLT